MQSPVDKPDEDLDFSFFVLVKLADAKLGLSPLHLAQYQISGICVLFNLAHLMWIQVEHPIKYIVL